MKEKRKMSTTKVHIKTTCNFCNGKAYIPISKLKDNEDGINTRYLPCSYCEGTGLLPKWISLIDFIRLIDTTNVMQPNYQVIEVVEPVSQYQDSRDSAGI